MKELWSYYELFNPKVILINILEARFKELIKQKN